MTEGCVYILNDNPVYQAMYSVSIRLLRRHNPRLPVHLIYVKDNNVDSWSDSGSIFSVIDKSMIERHMVWGDENIMRLSSAMGVSVDLVSNLPYKSQNFVSMQRCLFERCGLENALLLDTDTFIFKSIDGIFTTSPDLDMIACPMVGIVPETQNSQVTQQKMMFAYWCGDKVAKKSILPMNSGVVLFRKSLFKKYGSTVIDYCNRLNFKKHPMSSMMFVLRPDGRNREEVAFNLFVLENNIKSGYFDQNDVGIFNFDRNVSIFHTGSSAYAHWFTQFAKSGVLVNN